MTNKVQQLSDKLAQVFALKLKSNTVACGEVTIEVAVDDLLTVCLKLRDDSALAFEQLIDVCGVDYSEYAQTEWATEEATGTGFSRAVDVATHGRLRFGDESVEKKSDQPRFAAVYHLLSVSNNQRLRIRGFAENDAMPVGSEERRVGKEGRCRGGSGHINTR